MMNEIPPLSCCFLIQVRGYSAERTCSRSTHSCCALPETYNKPTDSFFKAVILKKSVSSLDFNHQG